MQQSNRSSTIGSNINRSKIPVPELLVKENKINKQDNHKKISEDVILDSEYFNEKDNKTVFKILNKNGRKEVKGVFKIGKFV